MNVRKAIKNTAIATGVLTGAVLLSTQDALVERMHPRYISGKITSIIEENHNPQGLPSHTEYYIGISSADGSTKTLYTNDSYIGFELNQNLFEKSWDDHIKMRIGFFEDEQGKFFQIKSLDQIEYPSEQEWNALISSKK